MTLGTVTDDNSDALQKDHPGVGHRDSARHVAPLEYVVRAGGMSLESGAWNFAGWPAVIADKMQKTIFTVIASPNWNVHGSRRPTECQLVPTAGAILNESIRQGLRPTGTARHP